MPRPFLFILSLTAVSVLIFATACTEPVDPDLDTDGDGLKDVREAELGTDPMARDTDSDGFHDGMEVNRGADPLDPYIWPYRSEEWPGFADEAEADGVDGDTYGIGDVMPDLRGTDQFGTSGVRLYDFYGHVILLDLSAGWCPPCRALAEEAQAFWEQHREQGFIIIHLMQDDTTADGIMEDGYQAVWADDFGLEFPVLRERMDLTSPGLAEAGIYEGYIPFTALIGRDMTLRSGHSGATGGMEYFTEEVEALLAE
jgi:thiol-disulfide isomerase/thioredoxin